MGKTTHGAYSPQPLQGFLCSPLVSAVRLAQALTVDYVDSSALRIRTLKPDPAVPGVLVSKSLTGFRAQSSG